METAYVVCTVCGTRWSLTHPRNFYSIQQPRECKNPECDAGWLDLPMFNDADAARRVDTLLAQSPRMRNEEVTTDVSGGARLTDGTPGGEARLGARHRRRRGDVKQ